MKLAKKITLYSISAILLIVSVLMIGCGDYKYGSILTVLSLLFCGWGSQRTMNPWFAHFNYAFFTYVLITEMGCIIDGLCLILLISSWIIYYRSSREMITS